MDSDMTDLKALRAAAEAANLYWPPETEIRSGRWSAIDKLINAMSPQTVIALLDRLEAAEKDAARLNWLVDNDVDAAYLFATISGTFIRDTVDAAMKDEQK